MSITVTSPGGQTATHQSPWSTPYGQDGFKIQLDNTGNKVSIFSDATVLGGQGNDTVLGNTDGTDSIALAGGNDVVSLNGGAGTIEGGTGKDSIRYYGVGDGLGSKAQIQGNQGGDTIIAGFGIPASVLGGQGHDELSLKPGGKGYVAGGLGNDTLIGGSIHGQWDTMYGGNPTQTSVDDVFRFDFVLGGVKNNNGNISLMIDPRVSNYKIMDFSKSDTLELHDVSSFARFGVPRSAWPKVVSNVRDDGHDVHLVMNTTHNGHATIDLVGIGGHGINSLNSLMSEGYHLTFS